MTADHELRALEHRVRTHLHTRAARITPATLRPPRPPLPAPGTARRVPRKFLLRMVIPGAVGAAAALGVLGWSVLAPDHGDGGQVPPPGGPGPVTSQLVPTPAASDPPPSSPTPMPPPVATPQPTPRPPTVVPPTSVSPSPATSQPPADTTAPTAAPPTPAATVTPTPAPGTTR